MYMGKKIIAVVPARGGSKGITNKNIVDVCGKPLIGYTIEAAQKSNYLDYIYVSTDDKDIAAVCRAFGVDIDELRPEELATDEAKTVDVISHVLKKFTLESFDYVVLLQPTQPLRQPRHIDEAIELIVPQFIESIVSVTEVCEHPLFMRTIELDGKLKSILNSDSTVRRQELKPFYRVNGAIYINRVDQILLDNISLNDNLYPYIMEKKYDIDIDDYNDLENLRRIVDRCNFFNDR